METEQPTFLERISSLLLREPEDREQLIQLLRSAHERKLLDADALSITEGALAASEITVREVMVPRAKMEVVDIEDSLDKIIERANRTAHSRFPVIEGNRDNVIGILLSKDLLRIPRNGTARLRDWLHPAIFIPESKRLNVLLREFRVSHNHMAIVVDEYAGVNGLITIEDVLEQIVGDIEDEYDFDATEDNIREDSFGHYRVKAQTSVEDFNARFGTNFDDEDCDTVGGLILNRLGQVPQRKEEIDFGGLHFVVLRADSRRLHTLLVTRLPVPAPTNDF
ncbi:MAG: CBS domain-containing protein [Candidatus Accumulibacter sp.]|jgi:magnesium and cobalt transporter|nr:CBS domain-containing protein [Accumulibacter sp.]